jgi:hypothetical protein
VSLYSLSSGGSYPGHGWRPLKKGLVGWDVYDLQSRLNNANKAGLALDGAFGALTKAAVMDFQAQNHLVVDGIAGAVTQVATGQAVALRGPLPQRVKGQMQKETSMLCGIYTPTYANGSQDTGPLQMNTQYHPDLSQNFDVTYAVRVLVGRINEYHEKYVRWGVNDERAWAAAQGAWNSPVYADRYARGESVPSTFLDYVAAVSIYA